ncbi:hypothetical protein [Chitinophaga sp. OAE865]|uniref:hypothetical protein n=1 Tax=Chitinophaga sp. OAE865 TaxID=2817898 RepID=UPI001AEA1A1A
MTRAIFMLGLFLLPLVAMAQEHPPDTIPKTKKLKEVTIKARWKDRHLALNKQYVVKDEFKPIEHYTFDLRDPVNPGREYFVLDFLNKELPRGWGSNSLLSCSGGIQYFIDEVEVSYSYVANCPLSAFAYAKVFQDLHPPCPAIVLYTRKGQDVKRRR